MHTYRYSVNIICTIQLLFLLFFFIKDLYLKSKTILSFNSK